MLKGIVLLIFGVSLILLGGLWFVQGTGIVHIRPLLCIANCGDVTGPAPLWAAIGLLSVAIGAAVTVFGTRSRGK